MGLQIRQKLSSLGPLLACDAQARQAPSSCATWRSRRRTSTAARWPSVDDAVRIMGRLQLGRELSEADVSDIVAFLESLTGEVPAQFATAPVLPVAAR